MKSRMTQPGSPAMTESKRQTWVQTERAAHDAWGDLCARNQRAAVLLHKLVAHMDKSGAVVASHSTLSSICGYSVATLKRAITDLRADRWIEVLQIGGKGGACAYVVNDRVAWADTREKRSMSMFSANVIVDRAEQQGVDTGPLRRIPTLMHPAELQLPSGPGAEPPSQPSIEGMEPDLPAIIQQDGQQWAVDRETGELQGVLPNVDIHPQE